MKKEYTFRTYAHAPELNRAFINGCEIPGYIPKAGTYEKMLKELRVFFKPRLKHLKVYIKHIGATEKLPNEVFNVGIRKPQKQLFFRWLNSRSRGKSDFLQSDGSYKKLEYDYKIIKVSIIN